MTSTNPDTTRLEHDSPIAEGNVELRVAANPASLPVIRAVVNDIATRADYDMDGIADLRLAVDEACSSLISLAAPDSSLLCRFSTRDEQLVIDTVASTDSDAALRTDTFSWHVLTALVDEVSTSVTEDTDGTGKVVHVELTKSKGSGS